MCLRGRLREVCGGLIHNSSKWQALRCLRCSAVTQAGMFTHGNTIQQLKKLHTELECYAFISRIFYCDYPQTQRLNNCTIPFLGPSGKANRKDRRETGGCCVWGGTDSSELVMAFRMMELFSIFIAVTAPLHVFVKTHRKSP